MCRYNKYIAKFSKLLKYSKDNKILNVHCTIDMYHKQRDNIIIYSLTSMVTSIVQEQRWRHRYSALIDRYWAEYLCYII